MTPGKDEVESPIAFTARYVSGLRFVEGECVQSPLLIDPLASRLCGAKGLKLAQDELFNLRAAQGDGKHLRVPARNKLVDDELLRAIHLLAKSGPGNIQVLSLGCGLDSRPWRLSFPTAASVRWFDIDFHEMIELKKRLLADADAEICATPVETSLAVAAAGSGAASSSVAAAAFPLATASYTAIALDLSKGMAARLGPALLGAGFDPLTPSIWVLEAVIFYMELGAACELLESIGALCAPGRSACKLIATCVDQELLAASQSMQNGSHVFAGLWHFSVGELLTRPSCVEHWVLDLQPRTTKELSLQRYGADTYVALYGGAECLFTADLRHVPTL